MVLNGGLAAEGAKDDGGVMAAEAEGVGEHRVHLSLAGLVGHVVEVAGWVRLGVVDGRGDDAFLNRQDGDGRLHPACRSD